MWTPLLLLHPMHCPLPVSHASFLPTPCLAISQLLSHLLPLAYMPFLLLSSLASLPLAVALSCCPELKHESWPPSPCAPCPHACSPRSPWSILQAPPSWGSRGLMFNPPLQQGGKVYLEQGRAVNLEPLHIPRHSQPPPMQQAARCFLVLRCFPARCRLRPLESAGILQEGARTWLLSPLIIGEISLPAS